MQSKENNTNQFILVLLGVVFILYFNTIFSFEDEVPRALIAFLYFGVLGAIKRRWDYVFLIGSTFIFLGLFFSFLEFNSIQLDDIIQALNSGRIVIVLYTFVLLPFLWLSQALNFFQLSRQLSFLFSKGLLRFFIPILLKLELIQHRYKSIMEIFLIKGYETRTYVGKMRLMPKWIIPLIVTTLMEGVESYHYNETMNTKTESLREMPKFFPVPLYKKFIIIVLFILLAVNFFI